MNTKNTITITPVPGQSWGRITKLLTRSNFFKEPIIVNSDGIKLKITHPDIDYNGRVYKPNKTKHGSYQCRVLMEIPKGKYYFDEEYSNEDCKIIYFNVSE